MLQLLFLKTTPLKVKFYFFNFLLGLKLIHLTAGILFSMPVSIDLLI